MAIPLQSFLLYDVYDVRLPFHPPKLIVEWIPEERSKEDVQEKRGWKEYKQP
jgi:hypothetical protein